MGFYEFTGLEVALAGDPNNLTKYIVSVDTSDPDLGSCNVPIPPTSYNPPLDSNHPNDPNNDFRFEEPACRVTLGDRGLVRRKPQWHTGCGESGIDGVALKSSRRQWQSGAGCKWQSSYGNNRQWWLLPVCRTLRLISDRSGNARWEEADIGTSWQ